MKHPILIFSLAGLASLVGLAAIVKRKPSRLPAGPVAVGPSTVKAPGK